MITNRLSKISFKKFADGTKSVNESDSPKQNKGGGFKMSEEQSSKRSTKNTGGGKTTVDLSGSWIEIFYNDEFSLDEESTSSEESTPVENNKEVATPKTEPTKVDSKESTSKKSLMDRYKENIGGYKRALAASKNSNSEIVVDPKTGLKYKNINYKPSSKQQKVDLKNNVTNTKHTEQKESKTGFKNAFELNNFLKNITKNNTNKNLNRERAWFKLSKNEQMLENENLLKNIDKEKKPIIVNPNTRAINLQKK